MKKRDTALLLTAGLLLTTVLFPTGNVYAAKSKAKTKTVYVVTKVTAPGKTDKFTYNKNGLLTKQTGSNASYTFAYNKKSLHLSKVTKKETYGTTTTTYTYDKKKRLTKDVEKSYDGFTITKKYFYNSKNRLKNLTYKERGPEAYGGILTSNYSYNKKGYVSKAAYDMGNSNICSYSYTYDGKGNIKKVNYKGPTPETLTIKNTYKKGKLTQQLITEKVDGNTTTTKLTYVCKQIKVPVKYYSVVQAQQRALCNYRAAGNSLANIEFGVFVQ